MSGNIEGSLFFSGDGAGKIEELMVVSGRSILRMSFIGHGES